MADDSTDPVADALAAALANPQSMSGDAGAITERSVDDLIKAANYLAARKSRGGGLRFFRIVPDGAVMGRRGLPTDFNSNPWC